MAKENLEIAVRVVEWLRRGRGRTQRSWRRPG